METTNASVQRNSALYETNRLRSEVERLKHEHDQVCVCELLVKFSFYLVLIFTLCYFYFCPFLNLFTFFITINESKSSR